MQQVVYCLVIQNVYLKQRSSIMFEMEIKYIHELYNICRERTSKWFISVEDYLYEYVPQYLAGGSVIMFANVAKLHRETFPYVRYIFIDDSYIGIVAYV